METLSDLLCQIQTKENPDPHCQPEYVNGVVCIEVNQLGRQVELVTFKVTAGILQIELSQLNSVASNLAFCVVAVKTVTMKQKHCRLSQLSWQRGGPVYQPARVRISVRPRWSFYFIAGANEWQNDCQILTHRHKGEIVQLILDCCIWSNVDLFRKI